MTDKKLEEQVEELIKVVTECAKCVFDELGPGWKEEIYQKAMEVALRSRGVIYETQRILPITFDEHVIGESIPDLVVWLKDGHKLAVVIDLKADTGLKEEHQVQVERYIKELRKQVRPGEEVYSCGLVINFVKESTSVKLKDGFEDLDGIQLLQVQA